jgi:thymidylate synthase
MFQAVVDNPDLSIHPNPVDGGARIAVACRWKDAHRRREQWPDVSIVGPLRTVRGIDLMIRSLLANPQIRVVLVDGSDLTPGEATTEALFDLWSLGVRPPGMGDDLTDDLIDMIRETVRLTRSKHPDFSPLTLLRLEEDEDRPGGQVILPPPPPVATAVAPHGDPGERVVGNTLIDVWPEVLHRILSFGHAIPSQYGATREILNLVSVFRDPRGILEDHRRAGWLGYDQAGAEDYARRVTTPWAPADAPYSYGTRIGATGFQGVTTLLETKNDDRGIGVSPWLPEDAGGGRGRPCLVWSQFRHVGGRLNLTFVFRSHDYFAAYPMNVAALTSWLVREADTNGLEVGTITCLSVSAHLYDRDWNAARAIVDDHLPKGHQWDPRSTWRVEVVPGQSGGKGRAIVQPNGSTVFGCVVDTLPFIRAVALTPDGVEVVGTFEGRTAADVQAKVERSGLLTTVGNALWLGRELAKAELQLQG